MEGKKPRSSDFKSARLIKKKFTFKYSPPSFFRKRDFWLYIGVLPDENILKVSV